MGWGHVVLGLCGLRLGQRGVDAQSLEGMREQWGEEEKEEGRGPGPARLPPSPPPGQEMGSR